MERSVLEPVIRLGSTVTVGRRVAAPLRSTMVSSLHDVVIKVPADSIERIRRNLTILVLFIVLLYEARGYWFVFGALALFSEWFSM